MPLFSVQRYIRDLLDDLPVATGQTLSAQITPPVRQNLNGPKAFVWGGHLQVDRQAGPRGKTPQESGFKSLNWEISVWIHYLTNPNSPSSDEAFPQLLDTAMRAIWSSPVNLFIDQNGVPTGQTVNLPTATQLWNVGENFRMDYDEVHTVQSQRMLYYTARILFDVGEKVQA